MNCEHELRRLKQEKNELVELLADVLNQACQHRGELSHDFLSSYEGAFSYFGIDGITISVEDFFMKKVPEKLEKLDDL